VIIITTKRNTSVFVGLFISGCKKGREARPEIADKEGKSVVFPSLWLAAENQ
jgi:hypothetical protein